MRASVSGGAAIAGMLLTWASFAPALDKQGAAHGGELVSDARGFAVSGSASVAAALYNPSYAARPDNSGTALLRYAVHADIDLIGPRLSIPIDVNTFTDSERAGARKLVPSELDLISGVTSTWRLSSALALEGGARVEHDRAIDTSAASQTYVDVRARLLASLAPVMPDLHAALAGGDVSGYFTVGVFAYNPSYFARPDNTGRALFRYAPHVELSLWQRRLRLALDGTMFTDRESQLFRPSELDLTPEVALTLGPVDLHLAYERDMPLDRGGLVQQWVYATLVYGFSLVSSDEPPTSGAAHANALAEVAAAHRSER